MLFCIKSTRPAVRLDLEIHGHHLIENSRTPWQSPELSPPVSGTSTVSPAIRAPAGRTAASPLHHLPSLCRPVIPSWKWRAEVACTVQETAFRIHHPVRSDSPSHTSAGTSDPPNIDRIGRYVSQLFRKALPLQGGRVGARPTRRAIVGHQRKVRLAVGHPQILSRRSRRALLVPVVVGRAWRDDRREGLR